MNELVIKQGNAADSEIELIDDNGSSEDLSSAQAATFAIKKDITSTAGSNTILFRDTTTGNLSIGVGKLIVTLSQAEANALVPGLYVGEAAVRFGATDWLHTYPFSVRILFSGVAHIA
jgi:hypothetical protein